MKKIQTIKNILVNQISLCLAEIEVLENFLASIKDRKSTSTTELVKMQALKKSVAVDVGTLFDNDERSVTLYQLFGYSIIGIWREHSGVKEVLNFRHKYVAHRDSKSLEINPFSFIGNRHIIDLRTVLNRIKQEIEKV